MMAFQFKLWIMFSFLYKLQNKGKNYFFKYIWFIINGRRNFLKIFMSLCTLFFGHTHFYPNIRTHLMWGRPLWAALF